MLAGILSMPVLADYIARPCEPFLIAAERIQGFGGVVFDAIAGRMAIRVKILKVAQRQFPAMKT